MKPHVSRGAELSIPAPEELDSFEAQFGFKLPASYRAFTQVFGAGSFFGSFKLFVPNGPYHEIGNLQDEVRELIEDNDYDYVSEQHKELEPVIRMIFLAEDITPCYYGWDSEDVRDPETREYAIRKYDFEYNVCPIVAASFPEFIHKYVLEEVPRFLGVAEDDVDDDDGRSKFSPATRKKKARPKPTAPPSATPKRTAKSTPKKRSATAERAFLLAIVANPDDPRPQRDYADWLDPDKDPIAELIRFRLDRAGLPEGERRPEELAAREADWVARLDKSWDRDLVTIGLLPAILSRLGAQVILTWSDEERHAKADRVDQAQRRIDQLPRPRHFRDLSRRSGSWSLPTTNSLPAKWMPSPELARFRRLDLHSTSIDDARFEAPWQDDEPGKSRLERPVRTG